MRNIVLVIIISLIQNVVSAFRFIHNADFDRCSKEVLKSPCNDQIQCFPPDGRRRTISLSFCEEICHDGFDLWPVDQTLARFSLWLVPAVVLIAHFHYAPLSMWNTFAVALHNVSSPIDSMWSMLTRQEIQWRYLRLAETYFGVQKGNHRHGGFLCNLTGYFRHERIVSEHSQHLAIVWSAYDEFGWTDASKSAMTIQAKGFEYSLDERELDFIRYASHQLTINRTESQRPTWFTVIGYLGAVSGAFLRTKILRENDQTSHTIAVVSLLSYFVALVVTSSNIGTYRSIPDALNTLQQLRQRLDDNRRSRNLSVEPSFFPTLEIREKTSWNYMARSESSMKVNRFSGQDLLALEGWLEVAAWTGMNSSWRPCKAITVEGSTRDRRSGRLGVCSVLFVVLGSYVPALILSTYSGTIGFGCRCLAWTFILSVWILSSLLDYGMKKRIPSAETLWMCTIVKDSMLSLVVAGTIIAVQVGFLNSCWCRSNVLTRGSNGKVYLGPFGEDEWKRNWVVWPSTSVSGFALMMTFGYLIHVVEFDWEKKFPIKTSRGVMCKSEEQRHRNLIELEYGRRIPNIKRRSSV